MMFIILVLACLLYAFRIFIFFKVGVKKLHLYDGFGLVMMISISAARTMSRFYNSR